MERLDVEIIKDPELKILSQGNRHPVICLVICVMLRSEWSVFTTLRETPHLDSIKAKERKAFPKEPHFFFF